MDRARGGADFGATLGCMELDDLLLAPFTVAQAAQCGLGREKVRRLCRDGVLQRPTRGVYASTHLPDDLTLRAAAAALVLPPGAVLCRRSAAWIRGVDLRVPGELPLPVEVLVGPGAHPPQRRDLVAYTSALPDDDVTIVGGQLVTTGLRTASDLGRYRPRTEAVVALDALSHAGHCDLDEVAALLPALQRRRGVRRLEAAVSLADARAESPMETRTRLVVVDAGLPSPEVQHEVLDEWGQVIARLDLAYPFCHLGLEYDGRMAHIGRIAFDHDRQRQNELLGLGWVLLRFVAHDVLWRPQYVAHQVRLRLDTHSASRTA